MFKKILSVLLVVVLLIPTMSLVAYADSGSSEMRLITSNEINSKLLEGAKKIKGIETFAVGDNMYDETEPNDTIYSAGRLYSDSTVVGELYDTDLDYFKLVFSSKTRVQFICVSDSSVVAAAICNSSGEILDVADFSYKDGSYFNVLDGEASAGTFYIVLFNDERYYSTDYMFYIQYSSSTSHTHSYTNSCDTTCNTCGATRSITHTYSNACDSTCNVCGATRNASHRYSNDCDEVCNVCYEERKAPHKYSNDCDEICNSCYKERQAPHVFPNIYDEECAECGYECEVVIYDLTPTSTGVYSFEPDSYVYGLDRDCYKIYDKQGNEVKYNKSKGGFPLVNGLTYSVRLLYLEYISDFEKWIYTMEAETIFPDTQAGAWYADAVAYSVGAGIISGYANGKFGTSDSIQRQDFLVMLARLEGVNLDEYKYKSRFPDVARGSYYEAAVNWGAENGIVTGYQNGEFGVGDKVTREQLVTFLYRYAEYIGVDVTVERGAEHGIATQYADYVKVSAFSREAIIWAIENGVISGKNSTTIAPQGKAQRCEVAKIMYNIFLNDLF